MITCKEVVRHNIKVVQKENLQTKICAQNLQNFTEMIRNNNLQICFTEPHFEKKFQSNRLQKPFPHRQFANKKKVVDKTTTTKNKLQKSCPAEQFVNKLSGTTRISTTIISKNTAYGSQCVFCQSK